MPSSAPTPCGSRPAPGLRSPDVQRWFDDHADFVRALARHLLGSSPDVDDVTQEVFVLAWRKRHEYRGGSERSFLAQLTVHRCLHARRARFWRRLMGLDAARDVPDVSSPERFAETREAFRRVDAALQAMSEKRRAAFVLFEIHGFTAQEISQALGCPLKTVHTRLFHARREFLARIDPAVAGEWTSRRT